MEPGYLAATDWFPFQAAKDAQHDDWLRFYAANNAKAAAMQDANGVSADLQMPQDTHPAATYAATAACARAATQPAAK